MDSQKQDAAALLHGRDWCWAVERRSCCEASLDLERRTTAAAVTLPASRSDEEGCVRCVDSCDRAAVLVRRASRAERRTAAIFVVPAANTPPRRDGSTTMLKASLRRCSGSLWWIDGSGWRNRARMGSGRSGRGRSRPKARTAPAAHSNPTLRGPSCSYVDGWALAGAADAGTSGIDSRHPASDLR